jgi:hypothetical protein
MTTLKLADGKVTVFNRLESPYWQVAFKLGDGSRIQKSLGTMDEAVARERAMVMYDEARCCFSRRTEPGFPSRSEPPLIMDFGSG